MVIATTRTTFDSATLRAVAYAARNGIRRAGSPTDPTLRTAAAREGALWALGVERLSPAVRELAERVAQLGRVDLLAVRAEGPWWMPLHDAGTIWRVRAEVRRRAGLPLVTDGRIAPLP